MYEDNHTIFVLDLINKENNTFTFLNIDSSLQSGIKYWIFMIFFNMQIIFL